MDSNTPSVSSANKPKFNFKQILRWKWLALALLAVIVAMLLVWKPWQHTISANGRTVTVTGDTTVKSEPDEYVFNTSYQNTDADKATAIKAAETKSNELVTKLKALGVADNRIKTSVSGYETAQSDYLGIKQPTPVPTDSGYTYTVQLTVTLSDRAQTQKVQDYLATTGPTGVVTPTSTFSERLRKRLESQARDAATKDARAKADQSAHNLGFKVGSVKSVDDGSGFDGGIIRPMMSSAANPEDKVASSSSKLSIQPGENELSYSVTVAYYIK